MKFGIGVASAGYAYSAYSYDPYGGTKRQSTWAYEDLSQEDYANPERERVCSDPMLVVAIIVFATVGGIFQWMRADKFKKELKENTTRVDKTLREELRVARARARENGVHKQLELLKEKHRERMLGKRKQHVAPDDQSNMVASEPAPPSPA
eukprot:Colp12_sorted_trinity150504_noHs@21080